MLKGLIFIGATCLLFASCDVRRKDAQANLINDTQHQTPVKNPTSIQLIDSAYNFGKVTEGDVVEYNYRFKNTGDKPLVITNTSASCGCTVPEKPEQPILPGETGFIKVKFNSEHRVGDAHKTINVESNAVPAFPVLALSGTVEAKKAE